MAAAAVVAVTLAGGGSNINIGFAGDAAIQYIDDAGNTLKVENEDFGILAYYSWQWLNQVTLSSAFNVSGAASLKGDETRSGSAKGVVKVGIRDDSVLMWHAGRTYTIQDASLKYGTSRPAYSH